MEEKDKIRCKFIQVKSGFNRGWYLAISTKMDWKIQKDIMTNKFFAGALVQDWNENFYRKHGCLNKYIIWFLNPNSREHFSEKLKEEIEVELKRNDCIFIE